MIEISTLCKNLNDSLGAYAAQQEFNRDIVIFSSVGDREPNTRISPDSNNVTRRIYGIFDAAPSTLVPISGLTIVQVAATVSFICDLHTLVDGEEKTESGEYAEVEELRKLLDGYAQTFNGTTSNGVLTYYSLSSVGESEIGSTESGEFVPVSLNVSFVYADGGYFGEDITLYIDGVRIWYNSFNQTRNVTIETALFDGQRKLEGVGVELANGIDFSAVLTEDNAFLLDEQEIVSDTIVPDINRWHWVSIQRGDNTPETYQMIFSSRVRSSEPAVVTSVSASMTEAIPRLTKPSQSIRYEGQYPADTSGTSRTVSVNIDPLVPRPNKYVLVDWNDPRDTVVNWVEVRPGENRVVSHEYPEFSTRYQFDIYTCTLGG